MENELRILRDLGRIASAVEASGFNHHASDLLQIQYELCQSFCALFIEAAGSLDFECEEEIEPESAGPIEPTNTWVLNCSTPRAGGSVSTTTDGVTGR